MNNDMQKLRRRILLMLHDDDNGNGQYSVGLKAALWELEHIDEPFVHNTNEEK